MLRSVCAAALLGLGAAQAATMVGPHWTAEDGIVRAVVGDALIWTENIYPDGSITVLIFPENGGFTPWVDHTDTVFLPDPGYRIVGYDVTYDLAYGGGTYLIQGGEYGADFGGLGPGETYVASGRFAANTGPAIDFTATGGGERALFTHYIGVSNYPVEFVMSVRGLNRFCLPGFDLFECAMGLGGQTVPSELTLYSIAIAPNVVSIPEPSTYGLLFAGLAAITMRSCSGRRPHGRSRRRAATPTKPNPASMKA